MRKYMVFFLLTILYSFNAVANESTKFKYNNKDYSWGFQSPAERSINQQQLLIRCQAKGTCFNRGINNPGLNTNSNGTNNGPANNVPLANTYGNVSNVIINLTCDENAVCRNIGTDNTPTQTNRDSTVKSDVDATFDTQNTTNSKEVHNYAE